jgi:ElaB/YqjD/DUF883 family membrane-anchored ribosome-binding protein
MDQINNEGLTPIRDTSSNQPQSQSGSKFDNIKGTVADKLKAAAQTLKSKGEQNTNVSGYASQASGWLEGAADYVRDVDPSQIKTDIQRQVRTNPARSLLIAGAAGLILGALFRRR